MHAHVQKTANHRPKREHNTIEVELQPTHDLSP
jgi:hypothetical protein